MYIRFDLYTYMLHIFEKLTLMFYSLFRVLYLNKTYFGFHVKNIDISITCVLDSIHAQYASNMFQYHVFVFIQVLEKTDFHLKIQVLENTVFRFKLKFYITKIGSYKYLKNKYV